MLGLVHESNIWTWLDENPKEKAIFQQRKDKVRDLLINGQLSRDLAKIHQLLEPRLRNHRTSIMV